MWLPATSGQTVKSAAFNVQVFGKSKTQKRDVMQILVKIFLRYGGAIIEEIRDKTEDAITALLAEINAASQTDNFTVTGPASMQTRRKDFERPPDCFSLTLKKSGVKMGYLAVHVSPRSVFDEMEALYDVASECETYAGTSNLVILGDMNADCSYLTKEARDKLRLKKDSRYKWRILDDMDTTVSPQKCAYDRVIVKGLQMERRIPKANPFNFTKEYRLDLAKVGCLVVLHLNT
ncbi:deoxyribonuclease 1 2 [Echinococcus multilocularis]|uniref:Deoxyribonuclease 1 2 n=1 Tax=Echinococcus multilocularis TaxID=6211 RepID=A0A068Y373_ECHMU|nr:deoxyribonuclease 1 2 [Echinococcus multilocularis]CUT99868.1 deoxyribonuclease 1 2 [Echinococcus multilocularis]